MAARADQRKKLERLCRYTAGPAVCEQRLSLTRNGSVRYQLKTPYRDGTEHVIFEPRDFIARLAALVPKLRANLTRFHGVFAPIAGTAGADSGRKSRSDDLGRHGRRVFGIGTETCRARGRVVRIIASTEHPKVTANILNQLDAQASEPELPRRPPSPAPPQGRLFD